MKVLETERLVVRQLTEADAGFILRLVNEPSWLRFIGDRGVGNLEQARAYILQGAIASYARFGFGAYLLALKESGAAIGTCGLIKRDGLEDVDIGYALLPEYWGNGYACEAAAAVKEYARTALGLPRLLAITTQDNDSSMKLLGKLGFRFERLICLPGDTQELRLYAAELS